MVTLWCLQFSLKPPELCYWHHRLPIQGNAVKFISVLSTPNKSSKQGTIWQIRPWKCGFSMWGVKSLKSWVITACTFSPGISYSYFTCHFLVHPITSLSLSLSLFPLPPCSAASTILFGPFFLFFSFFFLGVGGWLWVQQENKRPEQIRRFYNALLGGGRGAERSRDWRDGMMYVAAVSLLSSSPLSLIMAISFFSELPGLHWASEKPLFFHGKREERGPGTFRSSFILLPGVCHLPCLFSPPFPHSNFLFVPGRGMVGGGPNPGLLSRHNKGHTVVVHERVWESSWKSELKDKFVLLQKCLICAYARS